MRRKPAGRFCGGGVLDARGGARQTTACRSPGRACPAPYSNENRDTSPSGSMSLFLMRFYTFLNPTLCINRTNAADPERPA